MIALLAALVLATPSPAPEAVTIATVNGEARLPVRLDADGAALLAARPLLAALGGTVRHEADWAAVLVARQQFRFLVGAPFYRFADRLELLAVPALLRGDSLFLPLEFVSRVLPRVFSERYAWDPVTARLTDAGWRMVRGSPAPAAPAPAAVPAAGRPAAPDRAPSAAARASGLRRRHVVTIDPGHGGADPGNPGLYFPKGVREKHVTLQIGLLLREELRQRGIEVRMTRTADVRPPLLERAPLCDAECDLFISLHVDALDPKRNRRFRTISGFHSLIIGEENTEDADRVANLENEALRFESATDQATAERGLDFILKDLQMNEFLRESERAGALIQTRLAAVHTGVNRGVRQSNRLAVLNTARRPAVLVELGYSTHPGDARVMSERGSQRKLAEALADAVVDYLLEYERVTESGAPGR